MLAIRAPPGSKVDFPNFNLPAGREKRQLDHKFEQKMSKHEFESLRKKLDNKYHIWVSSENLQEDDDGENSGQMFTNKLIDQ